MGIQGTFGSIRDLAGPGGEISGHAPILGAPIGGAGIDLQISDGLDGSGISLNVGPGAEISGGASVGITVCGIISGGCSGSTGETILGADDGGFLGLAQENPE